MICIRTFLPTSGRVPLSSIARSFASLSDFSLDKDCRTIDIRTCRKTYSALGEKRSFIFRKCPSSGIDMTVNFLDTEPSAPASVPTVMAVHGAPGNYGDYAEVICKLKSKGFRVIAPNFPGLKFTDQTETFRHTTDEKAEFLNDWLDAINVKRIDVAVMHSSAVYPTLKLWDERKDLVKSLVLINPAGHRRIKAMKPEWFVSNLARVNMHPAGRKFFTVVGKKIAALFGVAVKVDGDHADNAVLACLTMYLAGVERLEGYLKKIRDQRTPTTYFMAERDKLVDTKIFYEMLEMLGGDASIANICSKGGDIIRAAPNSGPEWLRVFNIKDGGHYAFKSYSSLLDDEITNLLTRVYKTDFVSYRKRDATNVSLDDERRSSVYAVNFKRL